MPAGAFFHVVGASHFLSLRRRLSHQRRPPSRQRRERAAVPDAVRQSAGAEGLSSSTLNALWGFLNLVVGYLLVCQVGDFDLKNLADAAALAIGALAIALFSARHFGRFNGGNAPQRP